MIPSNVYYKDHQIIEIKNNSGGLFLTWVINNICTNKCSYCPELLHTGQNHAYDWEQVQNFVLECNARYGHINCLISGGEPTLSPFLKDLINLIYDTGGSIILNTNLSRTKSWWEDVAPKISNISVSYHAEYVPVDNEEEFIDKILFLSKYTEINVRIMMYHKLWDQCINFYNKLKNQQAGFNIEVVRITPNFGADKNFCQVNYTKEQEHFLETTGIIFDGKKSLPDTYRRIPNNYTMVHNNQLEKFDYEVASALQNTNQNNFYGWECNIGLESLFVMFDGRIRKANCEEDMGWIGNINSEINWPKSSIICNKTMCHCIADVFISKKQVKSG